jgi:hypothetical protein
VKNRKPALPSHQQTNPVTASVSRIEVRSEAKGPLVIKTPTAEFDVTPRGYIKAFLLHNSQRVTLDDPTVAAAGGGVTVAGKLIRDFILDLSKAVVIDAKGKLGNLGKRVDIAGHSASGLEETLSLEVYDDFPGMALVTAFWTADVGEAIGHVETLPLALSLPVSVGADRRIQTSLTLEPKTVLKPGDSSCSSANFLPRLSRGASLPL